MLGQLGDEPALRRSAELFALGIAAWAGYFALSFIGRIKRRFSELRDYLFRSQTFPHGALLLTGTGVVPGDDFTLRAGDEIAINVSGIGTLTNKVVVV